MSIIGHTLLTTVIFLFPIFDSEPLVYIRPPDPPVREISRVTLIPELIKVCTCESGNRHFDTDGTVLRGKVNPHDRGLCQINTDYHGAKATAMSLDLLDPDDHIKYANWLYKTQGLAPWNWSKSCWK